MWVGSLFGGRERIYIVVEREREGACTRYRRCGEGFGETAWCKVGRGTNRNGCVNAHPLDYKL